MSAKSNSTERVPSWVPAAAVVYLDHVENGRSIRSLARGAGCHASTILRQIRRYEHRRDDLLIDQALRRMAVATTSKGKHKTLVEGTQHMQLQEHTNTQNETTIPDDAELRQAAPRLLRRLNEVGACLAIAKDMDNAVIVREMPNGQTLKTAVVESHIAEAMALNDWISSSSEGRIKRYHITSSGRLALKRFLAEDEAVRVGVGAAGDPFSEQHRDWAERDTKDTNKRRGIRYNATESPLSALARRKDKDGEPFLTPELVAAGERLREDFELAQMGPRVTQNWEKFLNGGASSTIQMSGDGGGSDAARTRLMAALKDLGPGLGDVVLRSCCFLEGMEAVERRMGWSARSGKIVLRIALGRLKKIYDEENGNWSPLIG